jgi:putative PIG3 family NAD(P)H quinone oxidoreductase
MKAVVLSEYGDPDVMSWGEVAEPVPRPGEVLVRVAATAVNRADLLQRQGHYPPPPGTTDVIGLECSGTRVDTGEPVCALLAGGGYGELVAVPEGQLMPVPDGLDLVSASALPEVACTVCSNLVMVARLAAGEWVLLHGGGSGIGTHAIQVARALGARVAVTAGSAEKLGRCAELGAEVLINYREQDFVGEVQAATEGRGVDVVLDLLGASYLPRNVAVLATGGRLVTIGLQGGRVGELDLGMLLMKRASVHATSLRYRPVEQKAAICREVVQHVWPMVAAGAVRPVIDRVLPIAEVAAAHRLLESGHHIGKVVLSLG